MIRIGNLCVFAYISRVLLHLGFCVTRGVATLNHHLLTPATNYTARVTIQRNNLMGKFWRIVAIRQIFPRQSSRDWLIRILKSAHSSKFSL